MSLFSEEWTTVHKCREEYVKSVVGEGNFFTTLEGWIVIEGEHAGCPRGYRIYMHKWKFAKKSDGSTATFIPLTYLVKMADGYQKIHQEGDLTGIPVHKDVKGGEYLKADLGWGPWTAEAPSLRGFPPWENIMKEGDANSDEYTARRRLLGFFRRPMGSFPGQEPADKHHTNEEEWGSGPIVGVRHGWKLVRLRLEEKEDGTPIVYLTEWKRYGHYPPPKYYPGDPDIPEGVLLRGPLNVEKRKKFGYINPRPPSVLGKHPRDSDGESAAKELEAANEKIRLLESLVATRDVNAWIVKQHEDLNPTECSVCGEGGPQILDNFGIFIDENSVSCGHRCCGECAGKILKPGVFYDEYGNPVHLNPTCPHCRHPATSYVKVQKIR